MRHNQSTSILTASNSGDDTTGTKTGDVNLTLTQNETQLTENEDFQKSEMVSFVAKKILAFKQKLFQLWKSQLDQQLIILNEKQNMIQSNIEAMQVCICD